jgi:DNA polymerase-3 subunit alpha
VTVPIHNHSEYSALDGLATVKEIADRCEELECPCCGLTDHGTVAGHLQFGPELEKRGIKPIYGCELYHGVKTQFKRQERDQAHFVVGALTDEGLRNLWRMVDASADNFRFVGRVNWEILEKHSDGLFATSACVQGLVSQGIRNGNYDALNRYLDIYKENFYIEIHTYPTADQELMNKELVSIARERGVPLVYANDAHFASPSQYALHDMYTTMQVGDTISTPIQDRKMWHPMALYIMDEYDVRQHLTYLPDDVVDEALANTDVIGEKANARLPDTRRHMPVFIPKESSFVKEDVDATTLFIDLVKDGLYTRYGDPSEEVWERAVKEMEALLVEGLEHYFLQAWDFVQFCEQNDIARGPGRGSGAGCIVAYALGITDVDPLHYELIFERFWNPGRTKGFPDIDTDFEKGKRKDVKAYLAKRWGDKRVRDIGTISRLKPKAACDKTYKACEVTWTEKETFKKIMGTVPDIEILGPDSIGWDRDKDPGKTIYVMDHVAQPIQDFIQNQPLERQPVLEKWIDLVSNTVNRVGGYGVHPSGVVIADTDLDSELPCFYSRTNETKATMFPMKEVDKRQFVKQDILGLRTIDTLEDWRRQVKDQGVEVNWSNLEREDHPEEMWNLLDEGLTLGVFQIEKGYAKKLCEEFRPRSVEDLGIIVALNRPGPIRSGAPDSFIARRQGAEEVVYDHPMLEPILKETYGWFLYQEQVIRFFEELGYTKGEADSIRKILGKKDPQAMQQLYKGEGEWKDRGYVQMTEDKLSRYPLPLGVATVLRSEEPSEIIWKRLEEFAKYSFNKSHSIAYGTIAFRTLYAKYNAPAEFIMACIRTNPDEAGDYVREGNRLGVSVRPPDVLRSDHDVAVKDGEILFGLSNVKNIGVGTAKYILKLRKSWDISTREQLSAAVDREQQRWEEEKKGKSPKQQCRSNVIDALEKVGAFDAYSERQVTMPEIQSIERELLGVILTDDCEEAFRNNADLIENCDDYSVLETETEVRAKVPGVITEVKPTKVKATGKDMGVVTVEWHTKSVQFAVFPQQWAAYKFLWRERTPGIFTIKKTKRGYNFEDGMAL